MKKIVGRWIQGKSMKVRVEGPLNERNERAVLHQLKQAEKRGIDSLVVIINSYGGSLRVAKNIALSLHLLRSRKQMKNHLESPSIASPKISASTVQTSSSLLAQNALQVPALELDKLSVIGDLGFADQRYFLSSRNDPLLSVESFSSGPKALDIFSPAYQVADSKTSLKLVEQSARDLQENVLKNRQAHLSSKGVGEASFKESFFQGGSFNLNTAQDRAFIDGIESFNKFIQLRLSSQRILEGSDDLRYRAISFMRNGLQFFKQE